MVFCRSLSCAKWSFERSSASQSSRIVYAVAAAVVGCKVHLNAVGAPDTTGDTKDGSQRPAALRFLLGLYHGHEAFLDGVGGFCWAQAQRECFMQSVALGYEVFSFLSEFLSSFLELLYFFRLQGPDDVQSRLILELLKVHLS